MYGGSALYVRRSANELQNANELSRAYEHLHSANGEQICNLNLLHDAACGRTPPMRYRCPRCRRWEIPSRLDDLTATRMFQWKPYNTSCFGKVDSSWWIQGTGSAHNASASCWKDINFEVLRNRADASRVPNNHFLHPVYASRDRPITRRIHRLFEPFGYRTAQQIHSITSDHLYIEDNTGHLVWDCLTPRSVRKDKEGAPPCIVASDFSGRSRVSGARRVGGRPID